LRCLGFCFLAFFSTLRLIGRCPAEANREARRARKRSRARRARACSFLAASCPTSRPCCCPRRRRATTRPRAS
ncbi:hypothetical protein E2I00_006381, partial [Balaenoptera physalus]